MAIRFTRTAEEIERLSKALKRGDEQTFSFVFFGDNPASFSNAAFASLQALYSFAIVGISMSATYTEPTTIKDSLLVLTKSAAHAHYPSGNLITGDDLARMVFASAGQKTENLGGAPGGVDGLERPCIFIEKATTIYAHLHSNSVGGKIAAEISLKVLPIGDQ